MRNEPSNETDRIESIFKEESMWQREGVKATECYEVNVCIEQIDEISRSIIWVRIPETDCARSKEPNEAGESGSILENKKL